MKLGHVLALLAMAVAALGATALPAEAADNKPNIVVIMGDDIGIWIHRRLQLRHDLSFKTMKDRFL
jgi:ABC-type sugar transport system substrate-binding protein